MSLVRRSGQVVLVGVLLGACSTQPTPLVTPTSAGVPSVSPTELASASATTAAPTTRPPDASAAASLLPAPSILPSSAPSASGGASPSTGASFTTPLPPTRSMAWTGIRWQKLASTNPLAHVRSVTRWSRGFVATGDLVVSGSSARNRVWVSTDGGRWDELTPDVFGASTIVAGLAATNDGVVALTLRSGAFDENGVVSELEHWSLTGPWQTWTSTDGRSWAGHPGPAFTVPRGMSGWDGGHVTLVAGAGNDLVALVYGAQPLAYSRDGITWQTASLDAFPGGPAGWHVTSFAAFAPGFEAVGTTPTKSVAIVSADGRNWATSALPAACPAGDLAAAAGGLINVGSLGDPHSPVETWCGSIDGRSWRPLTGYPPLGPWVVGNECRGTCANGILLADGDRMLAYSGYPRQVGWTSADGRTWQPLLFAGGRPTGWTEAAGWQFTKILTPLGLVLISSQDGAVWLGAPLT